MNPESAGIKTVYLALFDRIKKKKIVLVGKLGKTGQWVMRYAVEDKINKNAKQQLKII